MTQRPKISTPIRRLSASDITSTQDEVAVEQPLELRIRLHDGSIPEAPLTVTMRTPGHDAELALGFLHGEGFIRRRSDVAQLSIRSDPSQVVAVQLAAGLESPKVTLERNFYLTSSCGVCGKASIEAVQKLVPKGRVADRFRIDTATLRALPQRLAERQSVFTSTGGLHAAAAVSVTGEILALFEDVGRHNAVDKLVGSALQRDDLELSGAGLLLSGRTSFELVQKAALAKIELIAAIGAPSSLAIELADSLGITLVGFLRASGFNVYCHAHRIAT